MKNDDIRYNVQHIINSIDDWLDVIDSESDPAEDFKKEGVFGKDVSPDMLYPYQAGVWKARAGMNADKIKRIKGYLHNEFKHIGVQSRRDKI